MNGYTESDEKVRNRWARWRLGGYGWTPKTDDEREQVRLLESVTPEAHEEYIADLVALAYMEAQE